MAVFAAVEFAVLLAGCGALSGLLGAGVGTALKQEKESEVSETFTHSLKQTKSALLVALKRMAVEVESQDGQKVIGKTKEHELEVELTPVTDKATRMTVKVGEGLKTDRATAQEVVEQTQRVLKNAATK